MLCMSTLPLLELELLVRTVPLLKRGGETGRKGGKELVLVLLALALAWRRYCRTGAVAVVLVLIKAVSHVAQLLLLLLLLLPL